jgi:predicted nucleotidyltransferase
MREFADADVRTLDTESIERVVDDAPVTLAILYGSHARGTATSRSDVDLAVSFEESLSSVERTRARLSLIEQLTVALDTDDVDVIPLRRAPPELRRVIDTDGIVLSGSADDLDMGESEERSTHADRLAAFDELLADIERVV